MMSDSDRADNRAERIEAKLSSLEAEVRSDIRYMREDIKTIKDAIENRRTRTMSQTAWLIGAVITVGIALMGFVMNEIRGESQLASLIIATEREKITSLEDDYRHMRSLVMDQGDGMLVSIARLQERQEQDDKRLRAIEWNMSDALGLRRDTDD